ncbi:MAG TPA: histidine phosphatase family protein [Pseudobacillus sp.]
MEITLMRHGKSNHTNKSAVSCSEFVKWVDDYDATGIIQEIALPEQTKEKAKEAKLIVTSTLSRSIQSADRLGIKSFIISDSLFREAEMPVLVSPLLNIKAPPSLWAVYHRCLWLMGYKGKKESMKGAKERAVKASNRLIELAVEYDHVLLAGHGVFNQFIAWELLKAGWRGNKKTGRHHWSCTSYTLPDAKNRHIRISELS